LTQHPETRRIRQKPKRSGALGYPIGGDSDTVAAITGSIAEAMFGIPDEIASKARSHLPDDMIKILERMDEYVKMN
jgi:ADP-ribosylglycohydrolase